MAYPLSEFDGTIKTKDWAQIPNFPWIKLNDDEWKWVDPATFFDVLPEVLDACRPLPGEEGHTRWSARFSMRQAPTVLCATR
jgi:hypothetical protein